MAETPPEPKPKPLADIALTVTMRDGLTILEQVRLIGTAEKARIDYDPEDQVTTVLLVMRAEPQPVGPLDELH